MTGTHPKRHGGYYLEIYKCFGDCYLELYHQLRCHYASAVTGHYPDVTSTTAVINWSLVYGRQGGPNKIIKPVSSPLQPLLL